MLPITTLEKTASSILYEIPHGKPDPSQPCTLGEDKRSRVAQTAGKGWNCWYYVLNFLRLRIGKHPCPELARAREIEKLASSRRKEMTKFDAEFPFSLSEVFHEHDSKYLKSMKHENKEKNMKALAHHKSLPTDDRMKKRIAIIEEFIKEGKSTLHDFVLEKWHSGFIAINQKYLKSLSGGFDITTETPLAKIPTVPRAAFVDAFACMQTADMYGLHTSDWNPHNGIDKLIAELKKNGPLAVGGKIGRHLYQEEPFKMNGQIGGRDIYAWKPGTKRSETLSGHFILIVGARKIKEKEAESKESEIKESSAKEPQYKEYVYFIDPSDPSDPKDRSLQKIYMISYKNLLSNIGSIRGVMLPDEKQFAYYGNFKLS